MGSLQQSTRTEVPAWTQLLLCTSICTLIFDWVVCQFRITSFLRQLKVIWQWSLMPENILWWLSLGGWYISLSVHFSGLLPDKMRYIDRIHGAWSNYFSRASSNGKCKEIFRLMGQKEIYKKNVSFVYWVNSLSWNQNITFFVGF